SIALTPDNRVLLALRDGLHLFDPHTEELVFLVHPEPGGVDNFLNDGKVGPDGAFWIGSAGIAPDGGPAGALYRVLPDGTVTKRVSEVFTSNGLAWSADGKTMIHSDSRGQWIDRYRFDPATGEMSQRRRIATPGPADGRPDGGAFDRDDCYWSAGVSAGCVNRYAMDGTLLARYPMPALAPTMPCFGGPDMRHLFVTSLRRKDDATDACGHLYWTTTHTPGVPIPPLRLRQGRGLT
uniref:SMP-30/gluconolactonase/LRE family protein n=1 Tax=Pelagibacterium montanilacus TaxID=2185280 RepID=UPI0013DF3314